MVFVVWQIRAKHGCRCRCRSVRAFHSSSSRPGETLACGLRWSGVVTVSLFGCAVCWQSRFHSFFCAAQLGRERRSVNRCRCSAPPARGRGERARCHAFLSFDRLVRRKKASLVLAGERAAPPLKFPPFVQSGRSKDRPFRSLRVRWSLNFLITCFCLNPNPQDCLPLFVFDPLTRRASAKLDGQAFFLFKKGLK